jgi:hypothetical protein
MRGGGGSPHIEGLCFRIGSATFAAWAKIGARVTSADLEAFAAAIHSLRPYSGPTAALKRLGQRG